MFAFEYFLSAGFAVDNLRGDKGVVGFVSQHIVLALVQNVLLFCWLFFLQTDANRTLAQTFLDFIVSQFPYYLQERLH